MSRTIPLTAGYATVVDDEDYEWLSQWKWWYSPGVKNKEEGYAARKSPMVNGKRTTILMHRQIMDAEPGEQIDHKNGNKLDNQRRNLRSATHGQNSSNKSKFRSHRLGYEFTSKYKGVCWIKAHRKWFAYISINGKNRHLGSFHDEVEAATAYDAAAIEAFGEYAVLNLPHR